VLAAEELTDRHSGSLQLLSFPGEISESPFKSRAQNRQVAPPPPPPPPIFSSTTALPPLRSTAITMVAHFT
jgi:hypothetical protein